jgi:hypothetical protein
MPHFRPTRTVQTFPDGSELIYLPDDNSYVWQRPEADPRYCAEVAILADSDTGALLEVIRAAQLEEQQAIRARLANGRTDSR